jgi:hypothetical protein
MTRDLVLAFLSNELAFVSNDRQLKAALTRKEKINMRSKILRRW